MDRRPGPGGGGEGTGWPDDADEYNDAMATATKHTLPGATYEDLRRLPENMVGQIINGVLYANARPASGLARGTSGLGSDLGAPFDRGKGGPGGWWILDEPEIHLGNDVLVPDLAGWRRERMPVMRDVPYFTQAPDWVCEVLSPSTAGLDRIKKSRVHAKQGVRHMWVIDPRARTLEVYRLHDGLWTQVSTHEADEKVRAEPFEAVELDLANLWVTEEASADR